MNIILRRRKLGKGSCAGIVNVSTTGIRTVRNWCDTIPSSAHYVFRWGCTSNIPRSEDSADPTVVVNTAKAIHWCADKRQGRLDMQAAGVSVPKTYTAEEFWDNTEDGHKQWVLRPPQHAQGRNLVCGIRDQIQWYIESYSQYSDGYVSEFTDKVAEYRVYVIQGRVACVASKTPADPSAVAWNVAQGGRFDNVRWSEWPMAAIAEALKASVVGGMDFCGVDVMMDAEGRAYVLEVNSAPSLTSPYRQQCFAKCFDYIVNNGKAHIPVANVSSWQDVIHPAVRGD